MPRRDLLRQASMHAAMTILRAPRTFAKEGKSRWPTTTKSKMIIRNGYHEPNNSTAILRLEASMMQTVSQERHPLNRCCALNLRFDRAASEDHGTLPVEPNLGDYPQTPDLRSIGWRSRKQHNAAQYLLHLISFVCCFITRPCRARSLPEGSGVRRGQLSPDLAAGTSSPPSSQACACCFSSSHAMHPCVACASAISCVRHRFAHPSAYRHYQESGDSLCCGARTSLLPEVSTLSTEAVSGIFGYSDVRRNTGRMKHFPELILRIMPYCLTS